MDKKKLRFAPLVRVSSEGQEKKGESLRTQTKNLQQDVNDLGGGITRWYSGQEHSSVDDERMILDRLLDDAQQNLFDAVIVSHIDRVGRDSLKSKTTQKILRDNGIRFFVRKQEFDLDDENDCLFLGLQQEIAEYFSKRQTRDAVRNRIERCKRNVPANSTLPYGRTFDRKTETWGIDPMRKEAVEKAVQRFLAGESMENIAKTMPPHGTCGRNAKKVGVSRMSLNTLFRKNLGTEWVIDFKPKKVKSIRETITLTVPPLIDDLKVIQRVQERIELNKRYQGKAQHEYLLQSMIYCADCGYALTGQSQLGYRYYRHPRYGCDPKPFTSIRADEIENKVWHGLGSIFKSGDALKEAIQSAYPDKEAIEDLEKERDYCNSQLAELRRRRAMLYEDRLDLTIDKKTFIQKDISLREQEDAFRARLEEATRKRDLVPNAKDAEELSKVYGRYIRVSKTPLTFKEKRRILEMVLRGEGYPRPKAGIYIKAKMEAGKSKIEDVEIVGALRPGTIEPKNKQPKNEQA